MEMDCNLRKLGQLCQVLPICLREIAKIYNYCLRMLSSHENFDIFLLLVGVIGTWVK